MLLAALLLQLWLLIDCPTCTVVAPPTALPTATTVATPIPTALPTPASLPLSDEQAASLVTPGAELKPENAVPNNSVPTAAQLAQLSISSGWMNPDGQRLLGLVTGGHRGTTDEILQWAAYKWGLDPNLLRAEAVVESHWRQHCIGDIGNGVSLSILQIKSGSWTGTCPNAGACTNLNCAAITAPTCLSNNNTAFGADYRAFVMRACIVGDGLSWFANQTPTWAGVKPWVTGPGANNQIEPCMGAWFSGNWGDAGAQNYWAGPAGVQSYMTKCGSDPACYAGAVRGKNARSGG
jgi:hypothetical protein